MRYSPIMTTPAPSHAPDWLGESALLADYLNPSLSLLDLSERHNLPIVDLVAWSERHDIAGLLIRLKSLADQRAALLTADHAPAAVTSLSAAAASALTTAAEAESPALRLRAIESARKASALLLRLAPRTLHHSRAKDASPPDNQAPYEVDPRAEQSRDSFASDTSATSHDAKGPGSELSLDLQNLIGAPDDPVFACAGPSP